MGCLDFLNHVYNNIFGLKYELNLSTRPEKFVGEIEVWDKAEKLLEEALNNLEKDSGHPWHLNPGDGAFYGPKIDIKVEDALGRKFQCATIQLDFQLPIRFDLNYQVPDADGNVSFKKPVMIHRAILGSVERFFAILLEHWGGKWPFWISPRQVKLCPVHEDQFEYAHSVAKQIHAAGFTVDVDDSDRKLPKKVREAQLEQFNFILVVGKEEKANGTVNVRTRDNEVHGEKTPDQLIEEFKVMQASYTQDSGVSNVQVSEEDKVRKQIEKVKADNAKKDDEIAKLKAELKGKK